MCQPGYNDRLPVTICCVLLCLTVGFQAEMSKSSCPEFTECDLKSDLKRNDLPGFLGKELPLREMAINGPNAIHLLFYKVQTLTNAFYFQTGNNVETPSLDFAGKNPN